MKMLTAIVLGIAVLSGNESFHETLHPYWGQTFEVDQEVFREKSELQDLFIFENARWGRVLALDGIIQLTTKDEFIYHEMIVHVPLLAHGSAKKVLIIGGGDGGSLREVLRHKNVEEAHLVEIDPGVIDLAKEYFPTLSNGAFDDERAKIIIADGAHYMRDADERYDVIICDSTDPIGPGEVLFTEEFYGNCKRCLKPGGIMVNQDSIPLLDYPYLLKTAKKRESHFKHLRFYKASVPTYVGGEMAFGFSSDKDYSHVTPALLKKRLKKVQGQMRYYTPNLHPGAFEWPACLFSDYFK